MEEIKPLPEDFEEVYGHVHTAAKLHCDMMKLFAINLKLMGITTVPASGAMVKMLEEQRSMD